MPRTKSNQPPAQVMCSRVPYELATATRAQAKEQGQRISERIREGLRALLASSGYEKQAIRELVQAATQGPAAVADVAGLLLGEATTKKEEKFIEKAALVVADAVLAVTAPKLINKPYAETDAGRDVLRAFRAATTKAEIESLQKKFAAQAEGKRAVAYIAKIAKQTIQENDRAVAKTAKKAKEAQSFRETIKIAQTSRANTINERKTKREASEAALEVLKDAEREFHAKQRAKAKTIEERAFINNVAKLRLETAAQAKAGREAARKDIEKNRAAKITVLAVKGPVQEAIAAELIQAATQGPAAVVEVAGLLLGEATSKKEQAFIEQAALAVAEVAPVKKPLVVPQLPPPAGFSPMGAKPKYSPGIETPEERALSTYADEIIAARERGESRSDVRDEWKARDLALAALHSTDKDNPNVTKKERLSWANRHNELAISLQGLKRPDYQKQAYIERAYYWAWEALADQAKSPGERIEKERREKERQRKAAEHQAKQKEKADQEKANRERKAAELLKKNEEHERKRLEKEAKQKTKEPECTEPGCEYSLVGAKCSIKAPLVVGSSTGGVFSAPARYCLVDIDDLTTSNDPLRNYSKTPGYPLEAQERDYEREIQEQYKVQQIADGLELDLIFNKAPGAIDGPPIANEDGIILGGNGRTMAVKLAYYGNSKTVNSDRIKLYLLKHAKDFGFTEAQLATFRRPFIVRTVRTGGKPEELAQWSRRLNQSLSQELNPTLIAVSRARFMRPDVLEELAALPDDENLSAWLFSPASRGLVRSLQNSGVIDARNSATFLLPNGLLSPAGKDLVNDLLVAVLIPNSDLIKALGPATTNSLAKAAPFLAQIGSLKEYNVLPELKIALQDLVYLRASGFTDVPRFMSQRGMFGIESKARGFRLAEIWLTILVELGTSPAKLSKLARYYLQLAKAPSSGQMGLLAQETYDPEQALLKAASVVGVKV